MLQLWHDELSTPRRLVMSAEKVITGKAILTKEREKKTGIYDLPIRAKTVAFFSAVPFVAWYPWMIRLFPTVGQFFLEAEAEAMGRWADH